MALGALAGALGGGLGLLGGAIGIGRAATTENFDPQMPRQVIEKQSYGGMGYDEARQRSRQADRRDEGLASYAGYQQGVGDQYGSRGMQGDVYGRMAGVSDRYARLAEGQGGAGRAQFQQGLDAAGRQAMGLAAGATGSGPQRAAMQLAAMNQAAGMTQQGASQAAQIAAAEQQAGIAGMAGMSGQMGGLAGQMRGQDLQRAGMDAETAARIRAMNDARAMQEMGFGQRGAELQYTTESQRSQNQAMLDQQREQAIRGLAMQDRERSDRMWGGVAQGFMGAGSGIMQAGMK